MSEPNWKPVIDYTGDKPLDLAETLGLVGAGVASDPLFVDSPHSSVALIAFGTSITTTHADAVAGGDAEQAAFVAAHNEGIAAMHDMGVYAGFKCRGDKTLLIALKVPYYDGSTSGRASSTFSLINGPASGELIITVPKERKTDSYIAIYSLTADALISDYKVAGGNSRCKFSLLNLPVGVKIYVCWAIVNGLGIGEYSAPYPIIVT